MLKRIKITETTYPFLKGDTIVLGRPINVIVGDQGSGKSTLLHMLKSGGPIKTTGATPNRVALLDGERDNPRTDPGETFRNPLGALVGSVIRSHGEVSLPMFLDFVRMAGPGDLVLMDEPDSGLSQRSVVALYRAMEEKSREGAQFVVSTHNPVMAGRVFDMETMREMEYGPDLARSLQGEEGKARLLERKLKVEDAMAKLKCALGVDCVCAAESSWYNNRCEEYIGRDGRRNGNRRGEWQKPDKTKT